MNPSFGLMQNLLCCKIAYAFLQNIVIQIFKNLGDFYNKKEKRLLTVVSSHRFPSNKQALKLRTLRFPHSREPKPDLPN